MLGTAWPVWTLLADATCDSDRLRDNRTNIGAKAVIRPIRARTAPPPLDRDADKWRNRIGRFFARREQLGATASRYETLDAIRHAHANLAATRIRLRACASVS